MLNLKGVRQTCLKSWNYSLSSSRFIGLIPTDVTLKSSAVSAMTSLSKLSPPGAHLESRTRVFQAQSVKSLPFKTDSLRSVPRTHSVEGESQRPQAELSGCVAACSHACTDTHLWSINYCLLTHSFFYSRSAVETMRWKASPCSKVSHWAHLCAPCSTFLVCPLNLVKSMSWETGTLKIRLWAYFPVNSELLQIESTSL